MVVVSEAAARAMLLAEKSGILPALFLPPVFFMLLVWRFSRLSGKDERKAKKKTNKKKTFSSNILICLLPPSSFSMAGSEENCCSDLDLVILIINT